ncbi:hypothetical protein ABZT51_24320 [Streptomyces sp. NPDC005373]|uniref:hypothetical protein n=1 Tax=Streptomyces sp. NPDC005373 TaxID=3156879 RepID=UPI0033A972B4
MWRARCGESRTAGSGSGLGKRAGRTTGTAPQADFHLCLFSSSDSAGPPGYRAVLRTLTDKLRHLPGGIVQRLGDKPLQALFERRCGAQATPTTPGAFAFGLRLVAWDGTALDVPDTPDNAVAFGFTGRDGTNKSGSPQVRLMALIECGTQQDFIPAA